MQPIQSLNLGDYWNNFVESQLNSGRYANINELMRDSLRLLEERQASFNLNLLRHALIEGEESGDGGELNMQQLKHEIKQEVGLL